MGVQPTDGARPVPDLQACRRPADLQLEPEVSLHVWTARMGYRGPDWLDISLQGNLKRVHREIGIFFAPSPALLYPYLSKRRSGRLTPDDWSRYTDEYLVQMRQSYRERRKAWDVLLSWEKVVLLCMCTPDDDGVLRCHRRLLAQILTRFGAIDHGELAAGQMPSIDPPPGG